MARDEKRRQGHAAQGGRFAPALWPVWVVALIAVVVAIALAGGIYLGLLALAVPHPGPNGERAVIDPLDVIKTTITVAGFVGAVLVGVYGYRKQRLVEGDAKRADAEQLAQRYATAADQMGHEKAAVRLAGVYAMARLADDWDDQRKVCIDVLCAYLRMPYEPDTASEKHREGEREVRLTIIRIIRDHLRDPSDSTTWCGHDLDFKDATFDGGVFDGAKFTGGSVSFDQAKFTGGEVSFSHAEFAGGEVFFSHAEFAGGEVFFSHAEFDGGECSFDNVKFTGGEVYFDFAEFTGGVVYFGGAEFTYCGFNLSGAKFTGGTAVQSISTARNSPAATCPSRAQNSLAAWSISSTPNSPTARSPSTRPNTPAAGSISAARHSPPVAVSNGVHSNPRQPGLRYKQGAVATREQDPLAGFATARVPMRAPLRARARGPVIRVWPQHAPL